MFFFLKRDLKQEKRFLHILRPFHMLKNLGLDCGEYLQFLVFLRKRKPVNDI